MKNLFLSFCLLAIVTITSPPIAKAGDINVKGGLITTMLNIPMMGVSGMVGYQTDASMINGGMNFLFNSKTKIEQEVTFYIHSLEGSATKTKNGDTGKVTVKWESIEMDYFILMNLGKGFKFGPGIGYGIGTIKEDAPYASLSTFLNTDDVHYGVLLLKAQKAFGDYNFEFTLSSFGGLISGALLCGTKF